MPESDIRPEKPRELKFKNKNCESYEDGWDKVGGGVGVLFGAIGIGLMIFLILAGIGACDRLSDPKGQHPGPVIEIHK